MAAVLLVECTGVWTISVLSNRPDRISSIMPKLINLILLLMCRIASYPCHANALSSIKDNLPRKYALLPTNWSLKTWSKMRCMLSRSLYGTESNKSAPFPLYALFLCGLVLYLLTLTCYALSRSTFLEVVELFRVCLIVYGVFGRWSACLFAVEWVGSVMTLSN